MKLLRLITCFQPSDDLGYSMVNAQKFVGQITVLYQLQLKQFQQIIY